MTSVSAQQGADEATVSLGFWLYLMTDCLVFASLFAAYAVLSGSTAGGVGGRDIFDMGFVLTETIVLLTSSATSGLALAEARRGQRRAAVWWLAITAILGAVFVGMELTEFAQLVADGHSWQASAFLSAFFTLVGTHGLHITIGLLWAGVLIWVLLRRGVTADSTKKLMLFTVFWHFLDIVWVCIFTFVYAMGLLS